MHLLIRKEILKSFSNAGKDYRMYVSYYRGKDKGWKDSRIYKSIMTNIINHEET